MRREIKLQLPMQSVARTCCENACPRADGFHSLVTLNPDRVPVDFDFGNSSAQVHLHRSFSRHAIEFMVKPGAIDNDGFDGGGTVLKLLAGWREKANCPKIIEDGCARYLKFAESVWS